MEHSNVEPLVLALGWLAAIAVLAMLLIFG